MTNTQGSTLGIIAEARDKYTVHECNQCAWRKCCSRGFGSEECGKRRESIWLKLGIEDGYFTQLLDSLEAAYKRERGDCAKLREAVKCLMDNLNIHLRWPSDQITVNRAVLDGMVMVCEKALAAPSRNCDMPLVVDGTADNNADKAWLVFRRHNPDAYFDVSGLLRCIDWLLAPATEKKGGTK